MDSRGSKKIKEIIGEKTEVVYLLRGHNHEEQPFYIYMAVKMNKLPEFSQAIKGPIKPDIERFGKVLAADLGDPTPEVMKYMEDNHNFDHATYLDMFNQSTLEAIKYISEHKDEFIDEIYEKMKKEENGT